MRQVTIPLPDSLEDELTALAEQQGLSLDQYILEVLTTQVKGAYTIQPQTADGVTQQSQEFTALLQRLGHASFEEIEAVLAEREVGKAEAGLTPEVMRALSQRLTQRVSES